VTTLPFARADIERARRPLGEATMLPTAAYTDPAVLAWEREHLFAASWVGTGRMRDLDEPGAQRATHDALLVRGEDDRVRAFANVCRHRGHELLAPGTATCASSVRCPYHGWTYDLDGRVRRATGGDVPDLEEWALAELAVAEWLGWMFVNASGDAPEIDEALDGLDAVLAPYDPARLVAVARHSYDVRANWKVLNENYQECLHCPRIHPELCRASPPESGDNVAPGPAWVGGWMDLRDDAETMSMSGRLAGVPLPGLDVSTRRRVAYFAVLPNLLVSAHPDYVLTHRLVALAPDLTRVECEWLADPAAGDLGDAVTLWDVTNRQDWAACESVQRGLASPHARPGPITAREDGVHHFVVKIANAYAAGAA
jgi:Rieske 2Fe-2S family protein